MPPGQKEFRKQLAAQARHYGPDAILFLKALMYGDEFFISKDGRRIEMPEELPAAERAKAANALLDRSAGKPAQAVNFSDEDGDDAALTINGQSPVDLLRMEYDRFIASRAAGIVLGANAAEPDAGGEEPV